jgi:hypothetical protein
LSGTTIIATALRSAPLDEWGALHPGVEYELGRLLMNIPGVAAVVFQPYELEVRKGRLFEWNDLLPSIVDSIRQVCSPFTELNEIIPSLSLRQRPIMVRPHCGFHKEV